MGLSAGQKKKKKLAGNLGGGGEGFDSGGPRELNTDEKKWQETGLGASGGNSQCKGPEVSVCLVCSWSPVWQKCGDQGSSRKGVQGGDVAREG